MCEYRESNQERKLAISNRKRLRQSVRIPWRIARGIHIMVKEQKARIDWRQVLDSPIDHPVVGVDTRVAARPVFLLK
jgi:hypothetical protein